MRAAVQLTTVHFAPLAGLQQPMSNSDMHHIGQHKAVVEYSCHQNRTYTPAATHFHVTSSRMLGYAMTWTMLLSLNPTASMLPLLLKRMVATSPESPVSDSWKAAAAHNTAEQPKQSKASKCESCHRRFVIEIWLPKHADRISYHAC
jgi:hypothetical protein